ncbi:hypothetical protein AX760_18910 [Pararhizobium antarcticum]|uniref:Phage tail assembly chaperone n=1 Tax=Pararhizobium antarcticum TaxID=1798805 RepID=A0A657LSJ8_9HYPH|nr:hypothetical protein AX760_18910 [Pararhizobium antarcticum]OJF99354.1 hypothetical protein AX761_11545 [Rhizobium sp. 58]
MTDTSVTDVKPFPWADVLHLGLCLLRLSPSDFWAMTPRELFAAGGWCKPRVGVPDRSGLEALMGAFPDGEVRRDEWEVMSG